MLLLETLNFYPFLPYCSSRWLSNWLAVLATQGHALMRRPTEDGCTGLVYFAKRNLIFVFFNGLNLHVPLSWLNGDGKDAFQALFSYN